VRSLRRSRTALIARSRAILQGQVTTEGQNICCPIASNCQVQLQYQSGVSEGAVRACSRPRPRADERAARR
jgi:hypothetical protein